MDRLPVESSNLASVGYDDNSETLEVEFLKGGAVYQYFNVPRVEYDRLMDAHALGSTHGKHQERISLRKAMKDIRFLNAGLPLQTFGQSLIWMRSMR